MDNPLNILFVPRWYPSRIDPMPGLFIRRQAEALAKKHKVWVISVHPDPALNDTFEVVRSVENSVSVCRVYYRQNSGRMIFSKITGLIRYVKAHHLGYMSLVPFTVDVVHGHILTREIFFALYMARKQARPCLVSEHWSRYFPANGTYRGTLRKFFTKRFLKRSSGLIAVSNSLATAMKDSGLAHPHTFIVPNLIDISAFVPAPSKTVDGKARILHVSCFEDKSKNISGFLEAVAEVFRRRNDFTVLMVGEGPDLSAMKELAAKLGLGARQVTFAGLRQEAELIEAYQSASFLVQSSRYETFGTVVIEALSCGIPVVSTPTGIAFSLIDKSNGILIQQSSVREIATAIDRMLDIYPTFEKQILHESVVGMFSENTVSEQLTAIYCETINTWQKD